jgi:hypothetical protein
VQPKAKLVLAKTAIAGLFALSSATTALAAEVGVAVNVAVPGVYGQISVGGGAPAPELIVARPTIAVPVRVVVPGPPPEPLYLHVPPGHELHWREHCHEYNACNRPVYFVSDHWYHNVYSPYHVSHHMEEHREAEHLRAEEIRHEEARREEHRIEEHRVERAEEHHAEERHAAEHRAEEHHDRDHDRDHDHR